MLIVTEPVKLSLFQITINERVFQCAGRPTRDCGCMFFTEVSTDRFRCMSCSTVWAISISDGISRYLYRTPG